MFNACPCWWTNDVRYPKHFKPLRCFHPAKHLHHPLGGCWEWEPQCQGYCDCQIASFTTFSPGRGAWFASWLVRKLRHSQQLSHAIWTRVHSPVGFEIDLMYVSLICWLPGCLFQGSMWQTWVTSYAALSLLELCVRTPRLCAWNAHCIRTSRVESLFVSDILVLSTWKITNPSCKKSDRKSMDIEL